MYQLLKPLLFLLSPERAHQVTVSLLKGLFALPGGPQLLNVLFRFSNSKLNKKVMGLTFENPIGLAAGFDKNGELVDEMDALGFGFIEVGTVTPLAQPGNKKPRLFRLPKDRAVINRMGFNNKGVEQLVKNLKKAKRKNIIVGGNIGKNKLTPNVDAVNDYVTCFEKLVDVVDYFVVNVSSPNTPNLRALQDKKPLTDLLSQLQELNSKQISSKPILLKIAPDLTDNQLADIVEIVQQTGISGLIATNTTISREGLMTSAAEVKKIGDGGLSGQPLKNRATEVIQYLRQALPKHVIIGVGGIDDLASAKEKLAAGADLIQIYTGLIYEGPGLIKQINQGLANS